MLQLLINRLNVSAFHIALMRTKAAAEAAGDMHEFMDEGFLLVFGRHFVKNLGDNFDGVGWRQVQDALPDFAQAVDAGNGAFGFATSAADAEHELGHHMIKLAFPRKLVDLFFDFWGFIIFYGHLFPSPTP